MRFLWLLALFIPLLATPEASAQTTALKVIRTLTAQAAEASAPSAGSFVALASASQATEVSFATGGAVGNTPDSVSICVWRLVGSVVQPVTKYTIAAADIARATPVIVFANAQSFYATACAFSGGSSPTVTLTVYARQVPTP